MLKSILSLMKCFRQIKIYNELYKTASDKATKTNAFAFSYINIRENYILQCQDTRKSYRIKFSLHFFVKGFAVKNCKKLL